MSSTPAFRRRESYGDSLGLPVDVWLYIIQCLDPYDYDKPDIMSLSATNKFFRDITLPVLFNTLDLCAPNLYNNVTRGYLLRDVIERIQAINSKPHILNAIRRLNLSHWVIRTDDDRENDMIVKNHFSDDDDYDPVRFREELREISQLINDGYREIVALLSNLPRLYHLECTDCILAPELFPHIFRMSSLQSLHIDGYSSVGDLINFQVTAPLQVFQLSPKHWYEPCLADTVKLFVPLIGQFTVLSIPVEILVHVLANTSLPILPKLRKFSIFKHITVARDQRDDLTYIRNFLSLTPNLYELRITSDFHDNTPFAIPDTMIPHLKRLTAPSCIANGIVPERKLDKLHVIVFDSRSFRKSYPSISRDIKRLIYTGTLNNTKEDLNHLAQVFPSATTVKIKVMENSTRSPQTLSHAILSILPEFRHLKQCSVSTVQGVYDHRWPAYCPLGRADDPKYRSHPTLKELQIYCWTWCPKNASWHSFAPLFCIVADELYTQRFFK